MLVIASRSRAKGVPLQRRVPSDANLSDRGRALWGARIFDPGWGDPTADTGMRPEESFRLRWEHVTWLNGRNGALLVTHGKTSAARRIVFMTPRVRAVLYGALGRVGEARRRMDMTRDDTQRSC